MAKLISVTDAVFDAIRYFRYRGVALNHIDSYAGVRAEQEDFANKRKQALAQLEKEKRIERRGKLWFIHPSSFRAVGGSCFKPEFEQNDFGVLLAILACKDGCDLRNLIQTFDFILRTLPSFEELYGGLNRLFSARLITQKRGLFFATSAATNLWMSARSHSKKSLYDEFVALERIVRCPCCGPRLEKVTWRITLPEEVFDIALKDYASKGP